MNDRLQYLKEEAYSENTSSKRLEILAGMDVELAQLVAINPNASRKLLKK